MEHLFETHREIAFNDETFQFLAKDEILVKSQRVQDAAGDSGLL